MGTPYVDYTCYLFTNFAIPLLNLFTKFGLPETPAVDQIWRTIQESKVEWDNLVITDASIGLRQEFNYYYSRYQ